MKKHARFEVYIVILLLLAAEQLPACQNPVPMQPGNPPEWLKTKIAPKSETGSFVRVYGDFSSTIDSAKKKAEDQAVSNARAMFGISCSVVNREVRDCNGNIIATYRIEAEWLGRCGVDEYVAYLLIQQDAYGKQFKPLPPSKTYEYTDEEKEEHKMLKMKWEKNLMRRAPIYISSEQNISGLQNLFANNGYRLTGDLADATYHLNVDIKICDKKSPKAYFCYAYVKADLNNVLTGKKEFIPDIDGCDRKSQIKGSHMSDENEACKDAFRKANLKLWEQIKDKFQ